jgi:hypothetical protein
MVSRLVDIYDRSIAALLQGSGYLRLACGTYMSTDDEIIWRGLLVTFDLSKGRVLTQPYLAIFCPIASSLIEEGLGRIYGKSVRDGRTAKLGQPIIIRPLYDSVRDLFGHDREPFSYHIETSDQVGDAAALVCDDFLRAAVKTLDKISTLRDLRDKVIEMSNNTSSGMNAMALSYIIDGKIKSKEIDNLALISPNPMTMKFAIYLKNRISPQP